MSNRNAGLSAKQDERLRFKRGYETNSRLGDRLREQRKACGLNRDQLAALIGVSPQLIQKYERGQSAIPADRLLELAQHLGVTISHFYSGLEMGDRALSATPEQRLADALPSVRGHGLREAVCQLVQTLSEEHATRDPKGN